MNLNKQDSSLLLYSCSSFPYLYSPLHSDWLIKVTNLFCISIDWLFQAINLFYIFIDCFFSILVYNVDLFIDYFRILVYTEDLLIDYFRILVYTVDLHVLIDYFRILVYTVDLLIDYFRILVYTVDLLIDYFRILITLCTAWWPHLLLWLTASCQCLSSQHPSSFTRTIKHHTSRSLHSITPTTSDWNSKVFIFTICFDRNFSFQNHRIGMA